MLGGRLSPLWHSLCAVPSPVSIWDGAGPDQVSLLKEADKVEVVPRDALVPVCAVAETLRRNKKTSKNGWVTGRFMEEIRISRGGGGE